MPEPEKPTGQVEKVKVMLLPVKLTEAEVALRSQELATAEGKLTEGERDLKSWIEVQKEAKKKRENENAATRDDVRRLGKVVRDRAEQRDVAIEERSNFDAWTVETYRCDTGELVTKRGMTPEERQRSLFEQQKAKTDRAKRGETATA